MFNGWLVKAGGVIVPLKYIQYASYSVTPAQRQDLDSEVAVTGVLHRNVVEHRRSKIEFNSMPDLSNKEVAEIGSIFHKAFTNEAERALNVEYYDPELDSYKSGVFYMPDTKYPIKQIQAETNIVIYDSLRYAFIEY